MPRWRSRRSRAPGRSSSKRGRRRCCLPRSRTSVRCSSSSRSCRCATAPTGRPIACQASAFPEPPGATLERCLARIRAWAADAEPVIQQLQRGESERAELVRWRHVLDAMAASSVDFARTVDAGPLVRVRLFVFPPDTEPAFPPGLLIRHFVADGWLHALAVGTVEELQPLAQQVTALKGQVHEMPSWLHTDMARNEAYVAAREAVLAREDAELRAQLAALARSPRAAHRALRRRAAAVGAAERPRAGVGEPVLLDHGLDERARPVIGWRAPSTDRVRARSCTIRRRRRASRRRCSSRIPGGRGRSRSSAARSACRRGTRPTRACCSRSPCR